MSKSNRNKRNGEQHNHTKKPTVTEIPNEPTVTEIPNEPTVTEIPNEPTVTEIPNEPDKGPAKKVKARELHLYRRATVVSAVQSVLRKGDVVYVRAPGEPMTFVETKDGVTGFVLSSHITK